MKKLILVISVMYGNMVLYSQSPTLPRINRFADIAGTIGSSEGSIASSFVYNWRIGKTRKWEAGFGIRATSYFGTKKDFITAPAKLARSTTTPLLLYSLARKQRIGTRLRYNARSLIP